MEGERGCAEVLRQIAAVRGAVKGLMLEVLEERIDTSVAGTKIATDAERRKGAGVLIEVMRICLR